MDPTAINDKRTAKEFSGMTFSKFKKSEAKKELLKSLLSGKIEPACYWAAEFICAGHLASLWECILLCCGRDIHLANPALPLYLCVRAEKFKDVVANGYTGNELKLRDSPKIRTLFAEIMAVLCQSRKKHSFATVKLENGSLDSTGIAGLCKAKDISYGQAVFQKEDPKEFFIAINELAFQLSPNSRNGTRACYWIEWILEYEAACKRKHKINFICGRRPHIPVPSKHQMDIIWIVWDLILYESSRRGSTHRKIIDSLLSLYCLRFTSGVRRKRRFLLYFAVAVVSDPFDVTLPLFTDQTPIDRARANINLIYAQVKKNEVSPNMSYLFTGGVDDGRNLERSIAKMEKISSMGPFIPRKT